MSDKDPYDFLPNQPNQSNEMDPTVAERLKRSGPKKPPSTPDEFKQFLTDKAAPRGPSKPLVFGQNGIVEGSQFAPKTFTPTGVKQTVQPIGKLPNAPEWTNAEGEQLEENPEVTEPTEIRTAVNYSELKDKIERQNSTQFFKPPNKKPNNPLSAYFRTPELYVRLPSQGMFNKPEDFNFTVDGMIGIYPMTAKDELVLRTPDALLNGSALRQIVESCAPDVHNVPELPSPDFDVLLLGIRSVSYGAQMDYETPCPKCKHVNAWGVDIPTILDTVKPIEGPTLLELKSKLKLTIIPYTFDSNVKAALVGFEEAQLIRAVQQQDIPERDRMIQFSESMARISELNRILFSSSITQIETPDGQLVTDKQFIQEFITEIPKPEFDRIDAAILAMNQSGFQRKMHLTCGNPECKHEHDVDITYDPTRFFAKGF